MHIRTIEFRGCPIEILRFGSRVYYYPQWNRNAEFTSFKHCCSYIRGWLWINRGCEASTGFNLWDISFVLNN